MMPSVNQFLSPQKADAIFYFIARMIHKGYLCFKKMLLLRIHLPNVN